MAGSWRKYTFFEKDVMSENISEVLGCNVTTLVAEGGVLLLGDENGCITITGRDFQGQQGEKRETKQVFRGPVHGLSYLFDMKNQSRQYIVGIGDDNPSFVAKTSATGKEARSVEAAAHAGINYTAVKIFNASDLSRPLLSFSAAFPGLGAHSKVTTSAVLRDGSAIVVGYSNGAIVLFAGCFMKDGTPANRAVPSQVLLMEHNHPVTGLFFAEFNSLKTPTENQIRLFAVLDTDVTIGNDPMNLIATTNSDIGGITVFDVSTTVSSSGVISLSTSRKPPHILDYRGASKFCSCYVNDTKELVVGRSEGIFSFSVDDRGSAAGLEGEKQCVSSVGRYILVASLDEKTRRNNITIYDLRNKFISFAGQIAADERVALVTHDGGIAYILTASQLLIRYRERDTLSKIEVLLKKSLYQLAISLAMEEQADVTEIMKLYKIYGDHLYKKGDFDAAMNQFIATIGYLQSSYVIRRYLDPHRILNLLTYLEKICERGLANKEHKTLLLTCYTKLKDEEKIKSFLQTHNVISNSSTNVSSAAKSGTIQATGSTLSSVSAVMSSAAVTAVIAVNAFSSDNNYSTIDSVACIDVLTNAGYIDYALQFAAAYSHHDKYLELQMSEDSVAGVDGALVYISSLSLHLSQDILKPLLLQHIPTFLDRNAMATTSLLIKLCCGDYQGVRAMLQASSMVGNTYIDYIKDVNKVAIQLTPFPLEELLPVYVDHEKSLKVLIEGVYLDNQSNAVNLSNRVSVGFHNRVLPIKVTNLLLELYLEDYELLKKTVSKDPSKLSNNTELKVVENKIMSLLDGHPNEYDLDRAMLLMYTYKFEKGTQYLLEKTMSTPLLIQMSIEKNDDKGIMKILRKEGAKESELYVQVLTYFVQRTITQQNSSKGDMDNDELWDSVAEVISLVEKEGTLTPAQVISILSLNPKLPFRIASKYILKVIQDLNSDNEVLQYNVDTTRHSIASVLMEESAKKQLGAMNDSTNSNRGNKRSKGTTRRLQSLSGDEEDDDFEDDLELHKREKAAEQRKWESILRAQVDRSTDHESFYAELEQSVDGFATIAGYFGKTIILDTNSS